MRFVITKNVIENVIASMQPFLEKKDSSSITSHIYLEINNTGLILKATDYEIGLESHIDNVNESEDELSAVTQVTAELISQFETTASNAPAINQPLKKVQ